MNIQQSTKNKKISIDSVIIVKFLINSESMIKFMLILDLKFL